MVFHHTRNRSWTENLFEPAVEGVARTHQISKRIQLLAHQTALVPPPCNLAIHEIEEEAKGHEGEGCPYGAKRIWWSQAVAHGGDDGHEAAEP